jgi:exopolysaccharide biosynthesis polyprenyl glycosylphosphotransferase
VIAKLYGLYDRDEERTDHSTADDFSGVFHMVTVCTWLFWVVNRLTGVAHPSAPKLVLFWAAAVGLVSVGRASSRAIARRNPIYLQNAIIVGAGDVGQMIAEKFLRHPEYGVNVVGFIDSQPKERREGLGQLALLGGMDRLFALVRLFDVERVVVAFSNDTHEDLLAVLRELQKLDVQVDVVPRLFDGLSPNLMVHTIEGIPVVGLPPLRLSRSSRLIKRSIDVVLSLIALIVLSPLFVGLAIAVFIDSGRPIIYRRRVLGRGGFEIDAFKFRSMRADLCVGDRYGGVGAARALQALLERPENAEDFEKHHKIEGDPRVTSVGRFLRRTSLDELPQLFNVVRGDMSLVGPRMITAEELGQYREGAETLLSIQPGITGYWQVNGRSLAGYEDRVRLDLAYIAGWSLSLDLRIIFRTVRVLLAQRGAR